MISLFLNVANTSTMQAIGAYYVGNGNHNTTPTLEQVIIAENIRIERSSTEEKVEIIKPALSIKANRKSYGHGGYGSFMPQRKT